jgi:hypothetical protein
MDMTLLLSSPIAGFILLGLMLYPLLQLNIFARKEDISDLRTKISDLRADIAEKYATNADFESLKDTITNISEHDQCQTQ